MIHGIDMRVLALALFAVAMYLVCWGVAAGAQRWGVLFPPGVMALELIVARAIDRRSSLGGVDHELRRLRRRVTV